MVTQQTLIEAKPPSVPDPKNALRNPNLRLYFAGQVVSMIGTWMQQMALAWLIYRMTNSAFMLGLIGFASQAPTFIFTPLAGLLADRTNRHRLVIITQTLAMVQASLLAILVLSGHAQIWSLIALGAFAGLISAFDLPTRQTFLVDMLDSKDQLPNAIALNSSITTGTRLVGPALAGIFIAWAGEGMCFVANAVSYIAVIVALCFIKAKQKKPVNQNGALQELVEGFKYTFGFRPIRSLILMVALVSLVAMPYGMLMPAFAKDVFHGNATTLGLLSAIAGVGSLIGTIFLASRKGVLGLGRWVLISCILFGAGLIGFGFSHSILMAVPFLVIAGFGSMVLLAACNTLLQTIVDEDKRGRVMSIFTMSFMGLAPFGSMAAGAIAGKVGAGYTVIGAGIFCLVLAALFSSKLSQIRKETRPVYIKRGIIQAEEELKIMNE